MTIAAMRTKIRLNPAAVALLVGLATLCVYLRTLASTIVFGSGPELTTAAYVGGVSQATGYPLYTMLGYLWTHLLPFGSIAYRMNLLSAFAAAGTAAVLYLLALRVTRSRISSVVAALLFAFSLTFWSQAVVAEVYALHLLFVVATLLCVVTWDATGERRWLYAGAFVWGLSFTHHTTTLLLIPGLLYFVLTSRHRGQFRRELRWTAPLFLLPLLIYAYLPLASMRSTGWMFADVRSWSAFVSHVTGHYFRDQAGLRTWGQPWQHLVEYAGPVVDDDRPGHHDNPGYLLSQFSLGLLWLAPWGLYGLLRRRRRLFALTGLVYLACLAWALYANLPDVEAYYLPTHLIVALWIGCGLRQCSVCLARLWRRLAVPRTSQRRLVTAFGAATPGLPLLLVMGNWQINDMRSVRSAHALGNAELDALKPHAVLICQGERWVFPALYVHQGEQRRPDVAVVPEYVFANPAGIRQLASLGLIVRKAETDGGTRSAADHRRLLAQFIADNLGTHPVYLAGPAMPVLARTPEMRAAVPALIPIAAAEPVFEVQNRRQAASMLP